MPSITRPGAQRLAVHVLDVVMDYGEDGEPFGEPVKRQDKSGKLLTFRWVLVSALNTPGAVQPDECGRAFSLSLLISDNETVELDKDSWDFCLKAAANTNMPPLWPGRIRQVLDAGGVDVADRVEAADGD
jgi:hypothetical protein